MKELPRSKEKRKAAHGAEKKQAHGAHDLVARQFGLHRQVEVRLVTQAAPPHLLNLRKKVEQPTSYAKYGVELDMELAELMKQCSDPKLAASLKGRRGGLKRYLSGYLVHFDSLDTLQVHEEFADYMDRAGFSWLMDLETYKVPLILCDEFFTSFKFDITKNLNKTCIKFRLFDEYHRMNLNEWSVRLGLYTVDDILSGEAEKLERGLPRRHVESDANAAWGYLTGLETNLPLF